MQKAHQLGRYFLLDRIAYGGMAEIFRAKTFDDEGRPHFVALKRVLSQLLEDDDFLAMMIDEAKIAAFLDHENIARLYELGHADGEYFLALEYVDGKDLRAVIERLRQSGKRLAPEQVAFIAMETARALHAAHTQRDASGRFLRIVHRDVSPSNVLLSYRGEVKLCDFGIAKATLTRSQTRTGVIKGKVKYMSPEQALGRPLDHRSDLFSLGTVMYEMLAAQPPFVAQTEVELIFAVRECRKRPLGELRADVPPPLADIIDRAMTRSRSARFQTGHEMAETLGEWLAAYAPTYRRGHLAQLMRQLFAPEIERELRLLESYVLDEVDPSRIGENLIADALGPDAPVTRFTPFAPPHEAHSGETRRPGVTDDDDDAQAGDDPFDGFDEESPGFSRDPRQPARPLHADSTRILDRAQLSHLSDQGTAILARPPVDLFEQPTRIAMRPTIHDESTRMLSIADVSRVPRRTARARPAPASIHDEETGERELPRAASLSDEETGERELPRDRSAPDELDAFDAVDSIEGEARLSDVQRAALLADATPDDDDVIFADDLDAEVIEDGADRSASEADYEARSFDVDGEPDEATGPPFPESDDDPFDRADSGDDDAPRSIHGESTRLFSIDALSPPSPAGGSASDATGDSALLEFLRKETQQRPAFAPGHGSVLDSDLAQPPPDAGPLAPATSVEATRIRAMPTAPDPGDATAIRAAPQAPRR